MIETLDAPLQDTLSREAEVASSASLSSESDHASAGETAAASLRIGREAIEILQCPGCGGALSVAADAMQCDACERTYPVADGVPVLVVPEKSLFDIETFTNAEPTFFRLSARSVN